MGYPNDNFYKVLKSKIDLNFSCKETKTIYSPTDKPSMVQSYSLPVLQAASTLLSIPTTGVINQTRLPSPTSPGQRARPNPSVPTGAADVQSGGHQFGTIKRPWDFTYVFIKGKDQIIGEIVLLFSNCTFRSTEPARSLAGLYLDFQYSESA